MGKRVASSPPSITYWPRTAAGLLPIAKVLVRRGHVSNHKPRSTTKYVDDFRIQISILKTKLFLL
jgi:hypothetical protein